MIEERERELRELRAQMVAPQAVPSRSAERGVGSPPNEASSRQEESQGEDFRTARDGAAARDIAVAF